MVAGRFALFFKKLLSGSAHWREASPAGWVLLLEICFRKGSTHTAGWSSQVARQAQGMDTKLKADVAESAVLTELLIRKFKVLKPVGDRLAYDLAIDHGDRLVRIQVKHAWYSETKRMYLVDSRRTKTNRRRMIRKKYSMADFDFAIIYLSDKRVFYIMPVEVFNSYASSICIVESGKRQRLPKSAEYRERWDLLSKVGC